MQRRQSQMSLRYTTTPNTTSALMAMTAQELRQLVYEGDSIVPSTCHILIKSLPGNKHCMDCGLEHPEMASINNGVLICSRCAVRHGVLGNRSVIKSMKLDQWSVEDILFLLEGGNMQLHQFLRRHKLVPKDPPRRSASAKLIDESSSVGTGSTHAKKMSTKELANRYKSASARYYRAELRTHITSIIESGRYQGRRLGFENEWRLRVAADNGTLGLSEDVIRKAMENYKDPDDAMMSPEDLEDDNERLKEELVRTRRNLEVRECELRILKGDAGRGNDFMGVSAGQENISVLSEVTGRDNITQRSASSSTVFSKTKSALKSFSTRNLFGRRRSGQPVDGESFGDYYSTRGRKKYADASSHNGNNAKFQSKAEALQVAVREEKAGRLRSLIHEQEIKSILYKTDYDLLEKQLAHNEVMFGEISAVMSRVEARQAELDTENKKRRKTIEMRMAQRSSYLVMVKKLRKKLNYRTTYGSNYAGTNGKKSTSTDGTFEGTDSDEFSNLCNRSQNLEMQRLKRLITSTRTVKRHDLLPPEKNSYPKPPMHAEVSDVDILRRTLQEQKRLCESRKADCDFMEKNLSQQKEFTSRLADLLVKVEDRQKKIDAENERLKNDMQHLEGQVSSLEDEIRHLKAKKINDDGVFAVVYEYTLLD